jgi:hypothetical protein
VTPSAGISPEEPIRRLKQRVAKPIERPAEDGRRLHRTVNMETKCIIMLVFNF